MTTIHPKRPGTTTRPSIRRPGHAGWNVASDWCPPPASTARPTAACWPGSTRTPARWPSSKATRCTQPAGVATALRVRPPSTRWTTRNASSTHSSGSGSGARAFGSASDGTRSSTRSGAVSAPPYERTEAMRLCTTWAGRATTATWSGSSTPGESTVTTATPMSAPAAPEWATPPGWASTGRRPTSLTQRSSSSSHPTWRLATTSTRTPNASWRASVVAQR